MGETTEVAETKWIIEKPQSGPFERTAAGLLAVAKQMIVDDAESQENADRFCLEVRRAEKDWIERVTPSVQAAKAAHTAAVALRDGPLKASGMARSIVEQKSLDYQARTRAEAEAKAREIEAQARKAEEDRKLAEAQAAADSGDKALADAILEEPIVVPNVRVILDAHIPTPGVSARETWKAEVTDLLSLIRYCAREGITSLLEANETALNTQARSLKSELRIPGVKAVMSKVRAYR